MARNLTKAHLEKMRKGRVLAAKRRGSVVKKRATKQIIKKPISSVIKKKAVSRETSLCVVKVDTVKGVGYLSGWTPDGPVFDTEISRAITKSNHDAKLLALAVYTSRTRGLEKVEVIKK